AEALALQCRSYGVDAQVIQGDFSSVESVLHFCQNYKKNFSETYALINNVGNYFIESSLNTPIETWTDLFQVNVHAPFILSQQLTPLFNKEKGRIINIGVSGLLRHSANTYSTAYNLTKECLWGMTKSLALELAPQSVTVNMVSPGILDISVEIPKNLSIIPMNKLGSSIEVTNAVLFLLNQSNDYITGQNIEVAGGLGLK
ncbi:MAG: SDR family oxidoreductase, partial [Parachlamydiaceae bacterium]|nr:SDR family oxidoreductase [Parachlamydiaceae bacterium]